MPKTKFLNLLFSCLLFACAHGANFTLKTSVNDTDFDWTVGDSYEGGKAPTGNGDTVIIPANIIAKVTAGDNASFNLINSIKRITPAAGAKLLVAVHGENVTNTLKCIVSSFDSVPSDEKPVGMLEKTGSGTLILGNGSDRIRPSKAYCCDYAVDVTVTQGVLLLPQNRQQGTELVVGVVHIAKSASLMLSSPANFQVHAYGLSGAGTVFYPNKDVGNNGKTLYSIFNVNAAKGIGKSVFSGAISGYSRLTVKHPAVVDLTGIGSDFSGSPVIVGRLGVMHFGNEKDSTSSIGTGNVNFSGTGGVVEYLGTEPETTDKPFWWTGFATIDAGVFGGVTFTKKFSNTSGGQYVLHLTGSNKTECVLANPFISVNNEDGSLKGTPCVKKSGSGTWRMANNSSRNMHGIIAVEDGTLKFDSIAERGVLCSLGYSDALRECAHGAFDTLASVEYAFLLGGDSTAGTLEYSGAVAAGNATRPMAVKSKGRFVSDSAVFRLEDVCSLGTGVKTLVLAGDSQHGNYATGLLDGTEAGSKLAVGKEGAGTWDLVRPTSFTGPLTSHGGIMRVDNRSKFRWYRICFTENGYGSGRYDTTYSVGMQEDGSPKRQSASEKSTVQLLEAALYDADGNNLLSGFTTGEPGNQNIPQYEFDGNYMLQTPGTAVIGSTAHEPNFIQENGQLFNLFDNKNTKTAGCTTQSSQGITLGNPSSWMVLVVRLPEDAPEAVRIDFMSSMTTNSTPESYNGRILTAFRLDGSVDGINWVEGIAKKDALVAPGAGAKWYSDPEGATVYGKRPGKGYAIARTSPSGSSSHAFTSVGAANGGVVDIIGTPYTVSGLVVDASASSGIISNVVFAAEGCIDVINVESFDFDSLELPGDYSHLEGYANLSRWKLRINGEDGVRMNVTLAGGKLTLKRRGLKIIIR